MKPNGNPQTADVAPMCTSATLGSRVREARLLRELGTSELATLVGITRAALEEIEKDTVQPTKHLLGRLADALSTSARYLAHGRAAPIARIDRSVIIPRELVALALESHWSFAKVKALAEARESLAVTHEGRAGSAFSRDDWRKLAGCLAPFMDFDGPTAD